MIDGIKVEGMAKNIHNVMKEWNTFDVDDNHTVCRNMDNIGSFTCDTNDMKKESCDYISDIKEEGAPVDIDNVTKDQITCNLGDVRWGGTKYYLENIKKERDSPNMDIIGKSCTSDSRPNDIKEDIYDSMQDIKKKGISQKKRSKH